MADSTTMVVPFATACPGATLTATTRPGIGARTAVSAACEPDRPVGTGEASGAFIQDDGIHRFALADDDAAGVGFAYQAAKHLAADQRREHAVRVALQDLDCLLRAVVHADEQPIAALDQLDGEFPLAQADPVPRNDQWAG